MWTFALLLFLVQGSPGPVWIFHDDLERDGRPMASFRTMELIDKPVRALHPDDQPASGSKFGLLTLGYQQRTTVPLVWHQSTGTLWLDSNGDGRFNPTERHSLATGSLSIKIIIDCGSEKVERTLLVKRRGEGLAYAVRGYQSGSVQLAGERYAALLLDGNADGCFDGVGQDRLWIDLNKDGRFDPLTEQFLLGKPLAHAGGLYLVRSNAGGTEVTVHPRPSETGIIRLKVGKLDASQITKLSTRLVSEWGELIEVTQDNLAAKLPVGKYRLDHVALTVQDKDQRRWSYQFFSTRTFEIKVEKGTDHFVDVVPDLKVTIDVEKSALPGERVEVRPNLVTSTGLYMTGCNRAGEEMRATLQLTNPGSEILDEATTGFA